MGNIMHKDQNRLKVKQINWQDIGKILEENRGLWDVFHLRRHFYFLFACICVDTRHLVRVHRRNIVGCAVQTNGTLLDHASMTAKQ